MLLECGKVNLKAMELLDKANTGRFGDPVPSPVFTGTKEGPAILVTGHDYLDLYELLKQTEGMGINIYTHGEMLPAHSYPELKKFNHLVGNYGTAWQNQKKEFEEFTGAILRTTNCVLLPKDSYKDRMFTCGIAKLPGVEHISGRDFTPLIEKAKACPALTEKDGKTVITGFHHKSVLGLADKIISRKGKSAGSSWWEAPMALKQGATITLS